MAPEAAAVAFHGTIIYSAALDDLRVLQDALLVVDASGGITTLQADVPASDLPAALETLGLAGCPVRELRRGQFLVPGFVDTHNHAPQWMQRGLGQGMHILDWLDAVTFPNEARFRDAAYARRVYGSLVSGMLRQGVTTASYYGSLHGEATRVLADVCLARGQRALVGKCNMDRNSPEYYRDASVEESLQTTRDCIAHIKHIDPDGRLVRPVLTPRFAISCNAALLEGLGAMAAQDPELPIQTHFNEAQQEITATLELFPGFKTEADLYQHFGLLTPRSILAHCTIMTPDEMQRLQDLGCGVAHCPTANMTVGGGFMAAPVKDFLRRGIKVGLGTDSGGGYSSSMLNAMRHSLVASFARDGLYNEDSDAALTLEEVFYMATAGGARVVGLGDQVGSFDQGKQFDALLVDLTEARHGVNAPLEDEDSIRTMFNKFLMTGDDRNIVEVYVKGKMVHST